MTLKDKREGAWYLESDVDDAVAELKKKIVGQCPKYPSRNVVIGFIDEVFGND
jgi:hypothetical protein